MTYFLNKPMSLDPGPASGLTGGIRTRAEGFWARWGTASMTGGFLNREDLTTQNDVVDELFAQARNRMSSDEAATLEARRELVGNGGNEWLLGELRRMADQNPEAWADLDLSEEGINAERDRRLNTQFQAMQNDIAMSPQGSWVSGLVADFGANMLGAKTLPFLIAGGGSGSFLRVAAREAAINAGITLALFPNMQEAAETLGTEQPSLVRELAMSATFGAAFGVGFEALGRGLRYGRELAAPRVEGRTALEAELETERAVAALQRGPEAVAALRGAEPIIVNPRRLAVPQWASEASALNHLQPAAPGAQLRSSTAMPSTAAAPAPIPMRRLLDDRQMFDRARTAAPEAFAEMETLVQRQADIRRNIARIETATPENPIRLADAVDAPQPTPARATEQPRAATERPQDALEPSAVAREAEAPPTPDLERLRGELAETETRMDAIRPKIAEAYRAARPPARAGQEVAPAASVDTTRMKAFDDPASPEAENLRAAVAADLREKIERDGDFPVLDENGKMRQASAVLDELDREDAFLARIDLCGMGP